MAGVNRAVLSKTSDKQPKYSVMIQGTCYAAIMNTVGVDGSETECNHVMEVLLLMII